MEDRITFRINELESKIVKFKSITKQSIDNKTVVVSVDCLTGLKTEDTLSGSFRFIEREADTI